MRPATRDAGPRRLRARRKRAAGSQALPGPFQGALPSPSQAKPATFTLADYCEPYHCDPPRKNPTEPLRRTLRREALLGTW